MVLLHARGGWLRNPAPPWMLETGSIYEEWDKPFIHWVSDPSTAYINVPTVHRYVDTC